MKTADELTALTLDFLSEHTNEAALAVVLGLVWHLIWERPKHLQYLNGVGPESDMSNDSASTQTQTTRTDHQTRKTTTLLRGNLRKEFQLVLEENEELERLVRELRFKIEQNQEDPTMLSPTPATYHHIGFDVPTTASNSRKRIRSSDAGILRSTVGWTTDELDLIGSCWAMLIFGFCLVSSRRTRRHKNPLATTIEMLETATLAAYVFVQDDVKPALSTIHAYFDIQGRNLFNQIVDPTSSTGELIASSKVRFTQFVEWIETLLYDQMLPIAAQYTQRATAFTQDVVQTIASIEFPSNWEELKLLLQRKERPPTILMSEHNDEVRRVQESLQRKISQHQALEEKNSDLQKALLGKETLLYEERMKTRSARLDAAKVTLEREETKRLESETTRATALALVAEDQKRLLRGFLSEHIMSKQQQDRLRRIDQQNNPKKTSTIVLPDPILQGFASAMYLNNISDLSSENASAGLSSSERLQQQQRLPQMTDCRDDFQNSDDDDYYGNPNETRLKEIREEFLRSKKMAQTLRPSQAITETNARTNRNTNQASTGSLLWNAASDPALKVVNDNSYASKKHQHELAAVALAQLAPSSWMGNAASIMCDWRTDGNDDEVRE